MDVNSISGDMAGFKQPPVSGAASLAQPVKVTAAADNKTVPSRAVANVDTKVSPSDKQTADAVIENLKKPVREMSHFVQSYNQRGEVRVKFMDNSNNVIYQIPSEMVAKMEDQMMKPETIADVNG